MDISQLANPMTRGLDCTAVGRDEIDLCCALTIERREDNGYANY